MWPWPRSSILAASPLHDSPPSPWGQGGATLRAGRLWGRNMPRDVQGDGTLSQAAGEADRSPESSRAASHGNTGATDQVRGQRPGPCGEARLPSRAAGHTGDPGGPSSQRWHPPSPQGAGPSALLTPRPQVHLPLIPRPRFWSSHHRCLWLRARTGERRSPLEQLPSIT